MKKKLGLILMVCLSALGAIYWNSAIRSAPLFVTSFSKEDQANESVVALGLSNSSRWKLTITGVDVDGPELPMDISYLVMKGRPVHANVISRTDDIFFQGPAIGATVQPENDNYSQFLSSGLVLRWQNSQDEALSAITIHYRLLGYPKKLSWLTPR